MKGNKHSCPRSPPGQHHMQNGELHQLLWHNVLHGRCGEAVTMSDN